MMTWVMVCVGLIACLWNPFQIVNAEDPTGSIFVHLEVAGEDGQPGEVVPGIEFDVYQVWTSNIETSEIQFQEPFGGLTSIDSSMSQDQIQKTALIFKEQVNNATPYMTGVVSDGNGDVLVENLPYGAYLFIQAKEHVVDENTYETTPFLVTVPYKDVNGEMVINVNATPKISLIKVTPPPTPTPTPTPSPTPSPTPTPSITPPPPVRTPTPTPRTWVPNTGDNFNVWLYGGILIGAVVLIGLALYMLRKKEK